VIGRHALYKNLLFIENNPEQYEVHHNSKQFFSGIEGQPTSLNAQKFGYTTSFYMGCLFIIWFHAGMRNEGI